jgi:pSer/pThr/pTyr-binding forkhead associated (FHA) protein
MDPEEGELINEPALEAAYDPEFEWPGDDEMPASGSNINSQTFAPSMRKHTLRLLVQNSTVLSTKKRLAIVDGYTEVQIGRDAPTAGTDSPRLRLKELAVSKLHATIFWDADREGWAIVDMGSKHGTFVAAEGARGPTSTTATSAGPGARLSAPRVASVPHTLRHLDRVTFGGTTFCVHIHSSRLPCDECSASVSGSKDEIPLFDAKAQNDETRPLEKRKQEEVEEEERASGWVPDGKNVKRALSSLKRDLLSRHGAAHSNAPHAVLYVDRSARRRALHPSTPSEMPGMPPVAHIPRRVESPTSAFSMAQPVPASAVKMQSAAAIPISSSNIGHKLLAKQGWQPGSTLGLPDGDSSGTRLLEPLTATPLPAKAGLGMFAPAERESSGVSSFQRRWRNAEGGG